MNDLLSSLLSKYGFAVIVAIVLAFIVVWAIAHQMSEPGSEVSVAWGLVKYTKTRPKHDTTGADVASDLGSRIVDEESKDASQPAPLTVDQIHFATEPSQTDYSNMRNEYGLRQLLPLESGLPIRRIPSGTFFFSLLPWFELEPPLLGDDFGRYEAQRYQTEYKLEFHKSSSGDLYIVGFMSNSDAARTSRLNGAEQSVVLNALWHADFPVMARIPVSRIVGSSHRRISLSENMEIDVLDITLR